MTGAISGAFTAASTTLIQSVGNGAAFGDQFSVGGWATSTLVGGLTGGLLGGATAYAQGNNIWTGSPLLTPAASSVNASLAPIVSDGTPDPANMINSIDPSEAAGGISPEAGGEGQWTEATQNPNITVDDKAVLGKINLHGFSNTHISEGLGQVFTNLGSPEATANAVLNDIHSVAPVLQEGPNNIIASIGGQQVTITAFVSNNVVIGADVFVGISQRIYTSGVQHLIVIQ